MDFGRKYSDLPDLDTSQDIFESPAGTKDETTDSPATSHTPSEADSASLTSDDATPQDEASGPRKTSRVARKGLSTSQARSHFASSRVDARGIDFSDRLSGARKSYRVPSKRTTRKRRIKDGRGGYAEEFELGSESEEENLEGRVARLRREVEEVKAESEQRGHGQEEAGEDAAWASSITVLGRTLAALQAQSRTVSSTRLPTTTNWPSTTPGSRATAASIQQAPSATQPPPQDIDRILASATTLEARLTALEQTLGLSALSAIQPSQPAPPRNVLTTMNKLESQLSTLNAATMPRIETMTGQIQALTNQAARLRDTRQAAKEARDAAGLTPLRTEAAVNGDHTKDAPATAAPPLADDIELSAQIEQLHATLSPLTALSPLIPSLLDRLKSLRILHADAATVSERFTEAETLQARMGGEIERWKDALEALEKKVQEVESVGKGNMGVVEGWVGELEGKLTKV